MLFSDTVRFFLLIRSIGTDIAINLRQASGTSCAPLIALRRASSH